MSIRRLTALVLMLGCACGADGSFDPESFRTTIGGPAAEVGRRVHPVADGGYLVVGETDAFGDSSNPAVVPRDLWVLRLDARARRRWDQGYGTALDERVLASAPTSDGGVLVLGVRGSSVLGDPRGGNFLAWFDASGEVLWERPVDDPQLGSLAATRDGGFIAIGHDRDGFVVLTRFDARADELWHRTYELDGLSGPAHVLQAADGGFIVSLVSGPTGRLPGLLRTDEHGEARWWAGYPRDPDDDFERLAVTAGLAERPDGTILLAGTSSCPVRPRFFTPEILAVDANGAELWRRTVPRSQENGIAGGVVALSNNDAAYVLNGDGIELVRFGPDGEVLGQSQVANAFVSSLVVLPGDGLLIVGGTPPESPSDVLLVGSTAPTG